MSQRGSGYERRSAALVPHLLKAAYIWEPACGTRLMANALEEIRADGIVTK
jgi:hypothetical protein